MIKTLPEAQYLFGRIGRTETATDTALSAYWKENYRVCVVGC